MLLPEGVGALPPGDYGSPGMVRVRLDAAFPHMVVGNPHHCAWPYLRRDVPHNWYVDARYPRCGFLSRDEALILYNNGVAFRGQRALEIGCWKGWSTCHLLAAGVRLDVIDPILQKPEFLQDVSDAVARTGRQLEIAPTLTLWAESSPDALDRLAEGGARWSFVFIDGSHDEPAPLHDAMAADRHACQDALILLHDLACPPVAAALEHLRASGWQVAFYQTAQIIGAAWRGDARPVPHRPDPDVAWTLPDHLRGFAQIDDGTGGARAPER